MLSKDEKLAIIRDTYEVTERGDTFDLVFSPLAPDESIYWINGVDETQAIELILAFEEDQMGWLDYCDGLDDVEDEPEPDPVQVELASEPEPEQELNFDPDVLPADQWGAHSLTPREIRGLTNGGSLSIGEW